MQSVWSESVRDRERIVSPTLEGDISVEALVIGGGMAGVMTAYYLKQAGIDCALAEAKTIGSGVTKNTTAKITAQHGLIYSGMIKRSGTEQARLYLDVNTRAIEAFRELAGIYPCDLEDKTAYVYTIDDRAKLEREADAYLKMGIEARISDNLPLPFKTAGAIGMRRQAQFNPLKLLLALAEELNIYENTFVKVVDGNTAITEKGRIKAAHIILATHFPLINIPGLYFIKLYQHRSYVIALENAPLINDMYVDDRLNGHSFRTYKNLLLVGGGDSKTGKRGGGLRELRGLAGRSWPSASEAFSWATQDCMTLDSIPYIGRHRQGAKNFYVAAGFNKWGMTGSMAAAEVIRDLILHGKSELTKVFSPQRSMLRPQLAVNVVSAAAGLLSIGGPRCTHMGCKLHWNSDEQSWDCSCHGSRFDKSGRIIDNPAKRGIRP